MWLQMSWGRGRTDTVTYGCMCVTKPSSGPGKKQPTETWWKQIRHFDEAWDSDYRWKYSKALRPHEARQQLGCPRYFCLTTERPHSKPLQKWGTGLRYTRWRELHFVLPYFPVQIINIILHCSPIMITECCITPNTWSPPSCADHSTDDGPSPLSSFNRLHLFVKIYMLIML